MVPDNFSLITRPNMYMIPLYVDLAQRKKGDRIPYSIANLNNEENLCLPQDFIVGFAEKDNNRGEVFKISYDKREIDINVADCRNWIPHATDRSINVGTSLKVLNPK